MILVTGGTGLIGSYLLLSLVSKGEQIRAIYRSENSLEKVKKLFGKYSDKDKELFDQIEWVQADLLDLPALTKAFDGVKKVYHSGAKVSFNKKDAKTLMQVNVEGTANMVNLALENNIDKICYVSSVAALGSYADNRCRDEEAIWQYTKNTSNYSISKYYAENEVWRAAEEGLNVVIVNPVTVIGYSNWEESSSMIIKRVNEGLPYYPTGSNGYVGVKDVVKAMELLMNSDIIGQRYLLVSENMSFKDILSQIAIALNKKAPRFAISRKLAQIAKAVDQTKAFLTRGNPTLTRESIEAAFAKRCFSADKIKKELGFEFEPMDKVIEEEVPLYIK